MFLSLFICLFVSVPDYSKSNEQIVITFYISRAWPKEESIKFWERFGQYSGYKNIIIFNGPIFNLFSMTLAFGLALLLNK